MTQPKKSEDSSSTEEKTLLQDTESAPINQEAESPPSLIVVGIGASAGGLEALQILFSSFPADTGMSFILAQHLSPSYKSMMVDLLEKDSTIPVVAARNGEKLEPNTLYIGPPGYNIEVAKNDTIILSMMGENRHIPRPSVDMLFESLAMAKGESAIGIVLSGTGTDGSRGIRAIKGEGGFGIVQDPNTAKYDGMPNAAINSGNVDLILTPEEMGPELKNISSFPRQIPLGSKAVLPRDSYFGILGVLKKRFNVDFTLYKENTIMRRIERRMRALKIFEVEEYVDFLNQKNNEAELLFNDMLIGVTAFFRDARAFNRLQEELSHYLHNKKNKVMRVWVPGCSTGEEAYSIAIILAEILGSLLEDYKIQIFATDIDKNAIDFARNGVYPESALQNLPNKIKRKYFTLKGEQFEVIKPIKMMVIFSEHNMIVDPPFLRLDLLSCRNLLIYFNLELQRQIWPIFHYALNHKGLLFLGQSESIGAFQESFSVLSKSGKIFEATFNGKKVIPVQQKTKNNLVDFVKDIPKNPLDKGHATQKKIDVLGELISLKIRDLMLPYSILINDNLDIVYSQGQNPLLIRPEGLPTNNIYQNIHPNLAIDLRSALHLLESKKEIARTAFQKLVIEKETVWARLIAVNVEHQAGLGALVLIFGQIEHVLDLPIAQIGGDESNQKVFEEQERLLLKTKQQLQIVIEELETSNEEMQSMNEELQSSNEELQSSNEELETTNEELQSTNEELQTAYSELRAAYEDKDRQQTELERLAKELEKTNSLLMDAETLGKTGSFHWEVPINLMVWSKGVYQLFGVNAETYQPTYEALIGLVYAQDRHAFEKFIENILTRGNAEEVTFRALGSKRQIIWLKLEVVVSFNSLKQAQYVMGTLTDITELKEAKNEIERQNQRVDVLLNGSLGGVYIYDFKLGHNSYINDAYTRILGYTLEELNSLSSEAFADLFHPDDLPVVLEHMQTVKSSTPGETFIIRYRFKHKMTGDYVLLHSKDSLYDGSDSAMIGMFMELSSVDNDSLAIPK